MDTRVSPALSPLPLTNLQFTLAHRPPIEHGPNGPIQLVRRPQAVRVTGRHRSQHLAGLTPNREKIVARSPLDSETGYFVGNLVKGGAARGRIALGRCAATAGLLVA